MPLTLEKLKELQEEALADDCEIEIERMASWTEAQVLLQNCATEDTELRTCLLYTSPSPRDS